MKKWISIVLLGCSSFAWAILSQAEPIQLPTSSETSIGSLNDEATYPRAKQLLERRKWPEAIVILRSLLKKEPRSVQIITGLATALTYTSSREEALGVLSQGIQDVRGEGRKFLIRKTRVLSCIFLTNKTFQTYQDGLNLMMSKKYRTARERFEKALIEEPDNVEILTRLGQSLLMDNDAGRAVPNFQLAYKLNAFSPEIRLWLGRAFFQLNKANSAVTELTAAGRELRGSELAPIWLADALNVVGQTPSAIRLLDNDVKQWPLHVLSLLSLARLRTQAPHLDSQILWLARKDLQLAISRLDQYAVSDFNRYSGDLVIDLSRTPVEIKNEIQKLQQQIESRLGQITDQR